MGLCDPGLYAGHYQIGGFAAGWSISFIAKDWLTVSCLSELGCMGLGHVLFLWGSNFMGVAHLAPDNEQPI